MTTTASHSAATSTSLHEPQGYTASSDPGAVGAGKWWLDTTVTDAPILKRRNAGNTAWIVVTTNGVELTYGANNMATTIDVAHIAGASAWTNTVAHFMRMRFPYIKAYATAYWNQGATTAGNIDIGIYSSSDGGVNLTKVVSTGSVAQVAANTLGSAALSASFTPVYGTDYWIGVYSDSNTATAGRTTLNTAGAALGLNRTVAHAAMPLPSSPAPATTSTAAWFIGFS